MSSLPFPIIIIPEKHVKETCKIDMGPHQCAYLVKIDKKFVCAKTRQLEKEIIDLELRALEKHFNEGKLTKINKKIPVGDNCKGYHND